MANLVADDSDDYGYDLSAEDEDLLFDTAASLSPPPPKLPLIHPLFGATAEEASRLAAAALDPGFSHAHEPSLFVGKFKAKAFPDQADAPAESASPLEGTGRHTPTEDDVSYPDLSRALSSLESEASDPKATQASDAGAKSPVDERSPLVRFRSFPRKPFSVSDLTAGSWCELQYYYTLTRLPFGKKTRTAIMQRGTKIHKELEDQVHKTVRIEVTSKEDAFGLRLWNIVQGLRTLRDTGLTRELEVWGILDGAVVNGIIDQLSYESPDTKFEEEVSSQETVKEVAADQKTITDFYPSTSTSQVDLPGPKVYITDVKTRGSLKVPSSPALLRPTKVQLFLYHRFLSEMAAGRLDMFRIFRRYGLDPDEPFSDTFLIQMGALDDEVFYDADSQAEGSSNSMPGSRSDRAESSDSPPPPDFVRCHTLRDFAALLASEIKTTFPHGKNSVGQLLGVEYRYREDGHVIDSIVLPVNDKALDLHLVRDFEWWRGERKAEGVPIEEAFKCRSCEFADSCTWRQELDQQRVDSARRKLQMPKQAS